MEYNNITCKYNGDPILLTLDKELKLTTEFNDATLYMYIFDSGNNLFYFGSNHYITLSIIGKSIKVIFRDVSKFGYKNSSILPSSYRILIFDNHEYQLKLNLDGGIL